MYQTIFQIVEQHMKFSVSNVNLLIYKEKKIIAKNEGSFFLFKKLHYFAKKFKFETVFNLFVQM